MDTLITTASGTLTVQAGPAGASQNPALHYLAGLLSERSRATMHQVLCAIAGRLTNTLHQRRGKLEYYLELNRLDWATQLTPGNVRLLRTLLATDMQPLTVNKYLAALRGVVKQAWNLDQIDDSQYRKTLDQAKIVKVDANRKPAGRDIKGGEIAALMDACTNDPTPIGARDAALIAVLYSCGVRRAELVNLDLADYDPDSGKLCVRHGKGNKQREVFIDNGGKEALDDWLATRGRLPGPLLVPIRKGGHLERRRMTTQGVYAIVKERAEQARLSLSLSPHDFRRTVTGDLLDKGIDLVTVQRILGHSSPSTTSRYDRRGEEARKAAASSLHVPYRRRRLA
jgi:integrase/recombinase XerD